MGLPADIVAHARKIHLLLFLCEPFAGSGGHDVEIAVHNIWCNCVFDVENSWENYIKFIISSRYCDTVGIVQHCTGIKSPVHA